MKKFIAFALVTSLAAISLAHDTTGTVPIISTSPATIRLIVLNDPAAPTVAQSTTQTLGQQFWSDVSQYIDLPLIYEFKPQSIGLFARVQVGNISKVGGDVDTLLGLAAPTNKTFFGKSFSDLTGQVGLGLSWSATWPKTKIYGRLGFGVLEASGGQPQGSAYFMVGSK